MLANSLHPGKEKRDSRAVAINRDLRLRVRERKNHAPNPEVWASNHARRKILCKPQSYPL
jgi:hypothetical protein